SGYSWLPLYRNTEFSDRPVVLVYVIEISFEFIAENLDEFPSRSARGLSTAGYAYTVIFDLNRDVRFSFPYLQFHPAVVSSCKGMFDRIGDHFVYHQPHGDGFIDVNLEGVALEMQMDVAFFQGK